MKPRDYQQYIIDQFIKYFTDGGTGNPLAAAPTGTGKSIIIAGFIEQVLKRWPGQRIILATHVQELIQQDYDKLLKVWPQAPVGIYSSGLKKRDTTSPVIFAGIASVAKRALDFGHVDLLLIDEAHLVSPTTGTQYLKFITGLKLTNPNLKVLGVSATIYRTSSGMLIPDENTKPEHKANSIFTDLVADLTTRDSFNWFIDQHYLSPVVPKRTDTELNIDGVKLQGGEFNLKQLQMCVDRDEITEACIRETMEAGVDRHKWLVFTSGVEHTIHTCDMLNMLGISATKVFTGSKAYPLSPKERTENLEAFARGEYRAMVNNNILTTGFDDPEIDLICMLRPTQSCGLWVQMLGRGTRPLYAPGYNLEELHGRKLAMAASQKQDCLVLDFAGNTRRLGPINEPNLPFKKKRKGNAPVKACDNCNLYVHASLALCPACGYQFPPPEEHQKLTAEASSEELIKRELPKIDVYNVLHITYSRHIKQSSPDSLKVTYFTGMTTFTEYVCVEHSNFAGKKAREWLLESAPNPNEVTTVNEALLAATTFYKPTHLRIWTNKQFPQIMAKCYDGTAFGTQDAEGIEIEVLVNSEVSNSAVTVSKVQIEEDDIPF